MVPTMAIASRRVPIGACGCIAVCWRVEQSGKKAFRTHQRCAAVFRHFALSFPSHYLGVAEAPQCVWILAPSMPGRSNSLQLGTGGKAVFQSFLCNVRVQSAVSVGIRPFARCGRVGVGHGRCRHTSFEKSRLAEPMSKITPSIRLPAVTSREFIINSQEAAKSFILRIKRCASPINVTNANDPARRQKRPKSPQRIDRSTQMLQDLMSKNRVEALSGEVWLINIAHVEGQVPCRFRFCE